MQLRVRRDIRMSACAQFAVYSHIRGKVKDVRAHDAGVDVYAIVPHDAAVTIPIPKPGCCAKTHTEFAKLFDET